MPWDAMSKVRPLGRRWLDSIERGGHGRQSSRRVAARWRPGLRALLVNAQQTKETSYTYKARKGLMPHPRLGLTKKPNKTKKAPILRHVCMCRRAGRGVRRFARHVGKS